MHTFNVNEEWPKEYTLLSNDPLAQDCVILINLSVSGRLSVEKLEKTHKALVERWPTLGGELITSTIPYSMSTGSLVDFKARSIDAKLEDVAPLDFTLSKSERDGREPLIREYRDAPTALKLADLSFDCLSTLNLKVGSLFAVRATLLQDATILTFKTSHYLVDGEGTYEIIEQFNNLLWDKPMPEPAMPPDLKAPMSTFVSGATDVEKPQDGKHNGAHFLRNFWQQGFATWASLLARYITKEYMGKMGVYGEAGVEKLIYLPKPWLQTRVGECQYELDQAAGEEKAPRLSKMDVVAAWCLQRTFKNAPAERPLDMGYGFNYSNFIRPDVRDKRYFHNHYYGMRVPFGTVGNMQNMSLAQMAAQVRRSVIASRDPNVIKENLEFVEEVQTQKILPLAADGHADGAPVFSSWTRFPFQNFDFSPAIEASSGTGKTLFNNAHVELPLSVLWKPYYIFHADPSGGIWCQSTQLPSHWKGFEDIACRK